MDINKCVEFSHHSGMLQFVCGLGPRKASYLLKTIRYGRGGRGYCSRVPRIEVLYEDAEKCRDFLTE